MKIPKFALAGILALALAGTASAQSTIRIIGATTYRAPVHAAIEAILSPGYAFADSGSSNSASQLGGASAAEFSGTLISNGDPVVIKTFWTGSVAGVADVVFPACDLRLHGRWTGCRRRHGPRQRLSQEPP